MPWINNEYIYTKRILKAIAHSYQFIYEGLPLSWRSEIYNPWIIVEFKADFDLALNSIGKGRWGGELNGPKMTDYRHFSHLQQIIIADILGIDDNELSGLGFYQIPQLRGRAYSDMIKFLNGEQSRMDKARRRRWVEERCRELLPISSFIKPTTQWDGHWDNRVKIYENNS